MPTPMPLSLSLPQADPTPQIPATPPFSEAALATLEQLRLTALACRSAARTDLFEACAMLSISPTVARDAHTKALVRCLDQALQKMPVIFRPGVAEISFDEAWILRAFEAVRAEDWDSFTFLLRARVAPPHRRLMAYLIGGIASPQAET